MRSITHLLFFVLFFAGLLPGCKKSPLTDHNDSQDLIRGAQAWFESQSAVPAREPFNRRTSTARVPVWDQARVLDQGDGPAVIVPVHYSRPFYLMTRQGGPRLYQGDDISHLVLYKDPTHVFHAEMVTALPDTSYIPRAGVPFTGLLLVDHWDGTPIARYKREGTTTREYIPGEAPTTQVTGFITQTCYEIIGYNYSPSDPDNGESWSEDAGCTANYSALGTPSSQFGLTAKTYLNIGGGGGSRPTSPAASFVILGGTNPIGNIADYNKCFTNSPADDHAYSVTIAVDQPSPGFRDPWGFTSGGFGGTKGTGNPVDVGHTFLIFSETYGLTTIIRNIGFYPQGTVDPWHPSDQGQLNNNAGHVFSISLTIKVDNLQFFKMLDYASLGNNTGFMYDLNSNNCTTFSLNTLAAGGVFVQSTKGTWIGNGYGYDPGDLGEDIRWMNLGSIKYFV